MGNGTSELSKSELKARIIPNEIIRNNHGEIITDVDVVSHRLKKIKEVSVYENVIHYLRQS